MVRDPAERFEFGRNWSKFLATVDDERIESSQRALLEKLNNMPLAGKTFLDIGSGSGLSSLAARRLGARVVSFDYDPASVACTSELRRRYFPDDPEWKVLQGSALDADFLKSLGDFDIVYSWGVLHHTGSMWLGIDNAAARVKPSGTLFIAIYNDQGPTSANWTRIKKLYVKLPRPLKPLLVLVIAGWFAFRAALRSIFRFQSPVPTKYFAERKATRGMSVWHDLVDWVGGYPFEVARPEEIFRYLRDRHFTLVELFTSGGGHACNEYIFRRE